MIPLVAAAHGTHDRAGLAATAELLDLVRGLRPGLRVEVGYVDIAEPLLSDTLGRLSGDVVVVPLLLGSGYHVRHDIPAALAAAPQVSARVAAALGPDPRLADILLDRLVEVGAFRPQPVDKKVETGEIMDDSACDAIVLAAAGSTDATANTDTARMAELLAELTGRTVVPSYLCAGAPTPRDAVDALRASGADHVALAGYLLGPGHFARKAAAAGATTVAEPLGAHPALAGLVLARYDQAVALSASAAAPTRANEARSLPWRPQGEATATANTTIQVPGETRDHLAQLAAERGMTIGRLVEAIAADQPTAAQRAERLAADREVARRLIGVDLSDQEFEEAPGILANILKTAAAKARAAPGGAS